MGLPKPKVATRAAAPSSSDRAAITQVTRRPRVLRRPEPDTALTEEGWFARPRLGPIGAEWDRERLPPRVRSHGLIFAIVSLALVAVSVLATILLVAPHAKEITSVPGASVAEGPRPAATPHREPTEEPPATIPTVREPTPRPPDVEPPPLEDPGQLPAVDDPARVPQGSGS